MAGTGLPSVVNPGQRVTAQVAPRARSAVPVRSPLEGLADISQQLGNMAEKEIATARAAYLGKAKVDAARKATELRIAHEYDPEGFQSAWDSYSSQTLAGFDPGLSTEMELSLAEYGTRQWSAVATEKRNRDRRQELDTISAALEQDQSDAIALAWDGQAGSDAYNHKLSSIKAQYDLLVESGHMSREQADIQIEQSFSTVGIESMMPEVTRIYETRGFEAAQAFAEDLATDPKFSLSPQQRMSFRSRALSDIGRKDARRRQMQAEARRIHNEQLRAARSAAKAAVPIIADPKVDFAQLDALKNTLLELGDQETYEAVMKAELIGQQHKAFGQLSIPEMDAVIGDMEERGVDDFGYEILETFRGVRNEASSQLDSDPISFFEHSSDLPQSRLDMGSPQALAASIDAREKIRDSAEARYDRRFDPVKPEEVQTFKDTFASAPLEDQAAMVTSIVRAAGPNAGDYLAVLAGNETTDALVQAAALGDQGLLLETVEGMQLVKDGVVTKPSRVVTDPPAVDVSRAFAGHPATLNAIRKTAEAATAAEMRRQGITDPQDSAIEDIYAEKLKRASGEREVNGVKIGGVAEVNGAPIVMPSYLPQEAAKEFLENLSPAEVAQYGVNGTPPTDSRGVVQDSVEDFYFVSIGDGLYRVSMSDPTEGVPEYLRGSGKYGLYEIQIPQDIAPVLERRNAPEPEPDSGGGVSEFFDGLIKPTDPFDLLSPEEQKRFREEQKRRGER